MLVWQNENYRIFKLTCWGYNCYILNHGGKNFLIDTGLRFIRGTLMKKLKKLNIDSISAVVLTHFHSDHAGNAAYIADKFDCPVYSSPVYAEWLSKGKCVMPRSNSLSAWVVNKLSRVFRFIHWDSFDSIPNIRDIDELMTSGILGGGVRKISLTAHTDDSICLVVDDEAAIVGDAFVHYPVVRKITLPWADHPEQIADTWRQLLELNCGIYCQGHGTPAKRKALEKAVKI